MATILICPCCGARSGEQHDDDCALRAYVTSNPIVEAEGHAAPQAAAKKRDAPMLLDAAAGHMRDRAAIYDQPGGERSMGRTVRAFNTITGRDLTESEGWLLMQILKDVRDRQRQAPHIDSLEDCIAYSALKAEARMAESNNQN